MADEKKMLLEERRYGIITKESIKMMAECGGHADIQDTVAGIMGEDVSYRLREITQKSAQFMRHAKRKRMNTEDFNKACRVSDIQPIYGHGCVEKSPSFRQTREGEIFFVEDPEVNLAKASSSDFLPKQLGDTTIKAHWLSVEGIQKNSQNTQAPTKPDPGPLLKRYFDKITQAVMGFDTEMMKTALTDLRTNTNISPLLPALVSFVANGVKTVNHDLGQMMRLVYMVRALINNSSLYLEVQPYLQLLLQSVQWCLLEPVSPSGPSITDQWSLKDTAARLQAQMVSVWTNSVNRLERYTEKTLRETLYDSSQPYSSHYGAIVGLLALGAENLERVLIPHLATYLPPLTAAMELNSPETETQQSHAHKVYGAILLSVEFVLKKHIEEFKMECLPRKDDIDVINTGPTKNKKSSGFKSMFDKSPAGFYKEMSEYFGDSLYLRLSEIPELKWSVFKRTQGELVSGLGDTESQKTGEELLEALMEKVRQESLQRPQPRDNLVMERQQRDLDDRVNRQRLEQERRREDHRQQLLLRKQRQLLQESDDEIDVEGDVDKSVFNFGPGLLVEQGRAALAGPSSLRAPSQGIKMTFTKCHKLQSSILSLTDSPMSDPPAILSHNRQTSKRKHTPSPDFLDFSALEDFGSFSPSNVSTENDNSDYMTDFSGMAAKYRKLDS